MLGIRVFSLLVLGNDIVSEVDKGLRREVAMWKVVEHRAGQKYGVRGRRRMYRGLLYVMF